MININNNIKNKLWLDRNNINTGNLYYIENLFYIFSIYKWKKIINIGNNNDLIIKYKSKIYIVKIREDILALELYIENTILDSNTNQIFCVVKNAGDDGCFYGNDCWYNLLNWIQGEKRNVK